MAPHPPSSDRLTLVVFGASGDLAKKKVYPALLELFANNSLPKNTIILGYARSKYTSENFRKKIEAYLKGDSKVIQQFLSTCYYRVGQYHVAKDLRKALNSVSESLGTVSNEDRIFYLAIPPSRFSVVGEIVKEAGMSSTGYNRIVVEKPFGKDSESCRVLSEGLNERFQESQLYRIDHYLGKDPVRKLPALLNSDVMPASLSKDTVESVVIDWEEDIGTEGRSGYFDGYGIIRDIAQNHLLQILSLVAMDAGATRSHQQTDQLRMGKVKVLQHIHAIRGEDSVVGQYEGYLEHKGVAEGSMTVTFALLKLDVANSRWKGVPFYLRCGKALRDRKCEIVVRFKPDVRSVRSLVVRIQPKPAVIFEDWQGRKRSIPYARDSKFGAYAALLRDVIHGSRSCFVRYDELVLAWEIFTPLLHHLDKTQQHPTKYRYGSEGPEDAVSLLESLRSSGSRSVPRSKL